MLNIYSKLLAYNLRLFERLIILSYKLILKYIKGNTLF
jgi:hypothetical protein